MSSKPPSDNFPATLDTDSWLQFTLGAGEENPRIFALLEIQRTGLTPDLAPTVTAMKTGDSSQQCRRLAAEILAQDKFIQKDFKLSNRPDLSPDGLKQILEGAHSSLVPLLITSFRKAPPAETLSKWRQALQGPSSNVMLAIGLSLLAKFGTREDAENALPFLESEDANVVKSSLDLLFHQNRELFKARLESLFTSDKVDAQIHAISRLGSLNPDEGLYYLKNFLVAEDPFIRQKALPVLILFPFEKTARLLLQFLGNEDVPVLIVNAGLGICLNPHPSIPEKLYDIMLSSKGLKAHILQIALKTLFASIRASGILKDSEEEYFARLKEKLRQRRDASSIRITLDNLASDDLELRLDAIQELRNHLDTPSVREALEKQRTRETDADLKDLLIMILGKSEEEPAVPEAPMKLPPLSTPAPSPRASPVPAQVPTSPPSPAPPPPQAEPKEPFSLQVFIESSPQKQKLILNAINRRAEFSTIKTELAKINLDSLEKSVIHEIMRKYEKFGTRDDTPFLGGLLESPNPVTVYSAVHTLSILNPDFILTKVVVLLNHDDPRVKKNVLELYLSYKKEAAIKHLEKMIRAEDVKVRKAAIALLSLIDFPTAEPFIEKMVKTEKDDSNKTQLGYILMYNPSHNTLVQLYHLTHNPDGTTIPAHKATWISALESAEKVLELERSSLQGLVLKHIQEEKDLAMAALTQPSLRTSAKSAEKRQADIKIDQEAERAKLWENLWLGFKLVFGFLVLTIFPFWYYYTYVSPHTNPFRYLRSVKTTSAPVPGTKTATDETERLRNLKKIIGNKEQGKDSKEKPEN